MIRPVQPGWRQTAVACLAGRAPGTPRLVAGAAAETFAGVTGALDGRAGGLGALPGGAGGRDPAGLGPDERAAPGDFAGVGTAAVGVRGTAGAAAGPGVGGIPQTLQ